MAGYSATPLVRKLGMKPGMRIWLVDAPAHYDELIGEYPPDTVFFDPETSERADMIHAFVVSMEILERELPSWKSRLEKDAMLWISWPKGTSAIRTDLNRDLIREMGLESGLVDVKVCAVDNDWSGLKFVYRLRDR
jgi:hypothetical protein